MLELRPGPLSPTGQATVVRSALRGPRDEEHRRRLERERALAASLSAVSCVLSPLRTEETPEALLLVFRDPGTRPLSTLPRPLGRELGRFLNFAIALTEAVGALHAAKVMHLGLCPDAVRLGTSETDIYLAGLSEASRLRTEAADPQGALARPERLPYLAPEQTGRMNRPVDRRADLYALGVLLYEVATGRLPFEASDALGWVHAHLARRPVPPGRALPGLPDAVGAVLLRLLAKDVDERYRSTVGLLADLRVLEAAWRKDGQLGAFEPGRRDVADVVQVPERLYGRQAEFETLESRFARAATGAPVALWVRGEPGIGKTRLIGDLNRPVAAAGGLFAMGKADQLRRNLPFDAPVQAFRALLRQVLAWPEGRLDALRATMDAALGLNTSVLTDVLPELARLLPERPPAPALGGPEAELRFRLTFQRFVEVFATPEHPLFLFLDDLQWVDAASLALVESLLHASHGPCALCLVGSWRDTEVGPTHPLTEMLARLEAAGLEAPTLTLSPLAREALQSMIADALGGTLTGPEPAVVAALTQVVVEKTGANPFFAGRFLQRIAEDGHVEFDPSTFRFRVDLDAIGRAALADNVAEHLARDFGRLSPAAQRLLPGAAALGAHFCVDELASTLDVSANAVLDALHDAADLGFVQRTGPERGGEYRFVHDHLQTAVYGRLDPQTRAELHLTLARALGGARAGRSPEAVGEQVFAVAHHYEQARPCLETPDARVEAATVQLAAGVRAQASGAPEAAVRFLRSGITLLGDAPFAVDAVLATELHIALAQAERAHRNAEEALRLCDVIDAHPGRAWDRVRTAELRVYLLNNLMRLNEAAEQALALVATLGHPIAPALSMDDILAALGRIEVARADRPPAALVHLPELDDPEAAAVCRILATLLPTLAMAVPHMHVPAVATVLEIALTRGVTPDTAYATGHWGIIMAAGGQYAYAYAIGQLTDALRERFSDRPTIAGLVEVPMMTQHLAEPIRDCARTLHWGARRSLELGNPTGYGYCGNQALNFEMMAGTPLPVFEQTWRRVRTLVVEHQQFLALPPVDTWGQLAASLTGDFRGDPCDFVGPRFDFAASVPEFRRIGVVTSVLYAVNAAIWLCTLFGEPERALDYARTYAAELDAPINVPAFGRVVVRFHVLLALLDTGAGLETGFEAEYAALQALATQVPANHAHRVTLIEAELALRRGDFVAAGSGFEAAFAQARSERFLHDAALIAERAARAAERMEGTVLVRAWRREAIEAYDAWGATAKSTRLRQAWPDALPATERAPERTGPRTLDLDAALSAAETIAGEMDLERLLSRAMRLMCTTAGAERGALLLDREGLLQVEAVASGEGVEVVGGAALEGQAAVSPEIVQYVARAQETLVLSDAAADPRFSGTAYVTERAPRSVLCTPLMHRGRRTGVLYLENGLTTGAFTAERVEILRLLAFQAATAIENAMLYAAARAQAEELREKNEALSAVDRIKDELLARTSHELRTPLHGIIGLAQTVLDGALALDSASRRSLDMIVSSGRRLGNLINDILDFQTLKRRDIVLARGAVSVHDATAAVLALCEPLLTGRPVRLVNAVPAGEGADPVVFADPDRLAQILLNLVGNACKFTERGEIRVDATTEPARSGTPGGPEGDPVVTLRVRDTGIGIAPDVVARIFEGFEQGDASIARRYGGAGLGLTVARQLVELHGGSIRVESSEGQGSVFAFTLPVARPDERLRRPTEEVRERIASPLKTSRPTDIVAVTDEGRGRRVLVVDDEPVNVQVVLAQLGRAGYEVATALDGPTALEMLAQGLRPDAVLLDVMMPRMDGYEVCTRLRDRFPRHALPVVMLTARNQVDDLVQGLAAGANDYVTKPFTGQELLARLRTHLALSGVNAAIGQFVPYPFLQLLGRDSITDVRLGDSVARPMSVLFANMRAFTRLTEQMSTAETFRFINEYLGLLAPAVGRHGGFVDKYIGDAIMAIFDEGADAAVRAGLDMNLALDELNARRQRAGQAPIRIGVGVNTGELVLGTVGTAARMDTTVISEAVNVAARMQTLTRRYDTQLLVTEGTMAALADPSAYAHRILDQVTLPGRADALAVFEIYASDPEDVRAAKNATRPTFEQAVRAFHARSLPEAMRLFALCQALDPQDRVVGQYLDRCQKIQRQFAGDAWGGEI